MQMTSVRSRQTTAPSKKLRYTLPETLSKRGLLINTSKTEEYKISRINCDNNWKKCKLLGSILDTKNDINRRKGLAIAAAQNLNQIFNNKDVSIVTKTEVFKTYVEPIFLYNSELWTLKKTTINEIDCFHRKLMRTLVLNIRWPKTISNEKLYEKTNIKKWSEIINTRRLNWFRKIAKMSDDTPVKQALNYALEGYQKPRGKPKTTWISMVKKQLEQYNLNFNEALELAKHDDQWNEKISV